MSLLTSAAAYGAGLLDSAEGVEHALEPTLENSPLAILGNVGQMAKGGLEFYDGDRWTGACDMATGGLKGLGNASGYLEDVPGLGALVGGVGTAVSGLGTMATHTDQIDQGVWSNDEGGRNEFYAGAGDMTLGSAHAILGGLVTFGGAMSIGEAASGIGLPAELASLPLAATAETADLGLTLGETAVNGLGTTAGLVGAGLNYADGGDRNWAFQANDVVGAGEHLAVNGIMGAASSAADLYDYYAA